MNKLKFFAGIIALAGIIFTTSCVKDDFDQPEVYIPHPNLTANISIMGLKDLYNSSQSTIYKIESDTIVVGYVVANDVSGNLYKTLVIQDSTGGIEIKLDATGLYNDYPVGQKLYVKCKGLYLGTYGTMIQLGYLYQGSIGRIPQIYIAEHLFKDGLPEKPIEPALKTIGGLSLADLNTIVRFDSVNFVEGGTNIFCTQTVSSAEDRVLKDQAGNQIIVRTSKYASFAGETLPSGLGTIIGELSIYNGTYQLYIRDKNDIQNFQPDPYSYLLNEPWTSEIGDFTQYSVVGNQIWGITQYGMTISGYVSSVYNENEDWLISPAMNLDLYNTEVLKFESAMKYGTAGQGLQVLYSTDYMGTGDPNQATWNTIPATLSQGNFTWTGSGDIDLSQITGTNVYIAFKYNCGTTSASCATWELRNLLLKAVKN